ncbi:25786_t:CDS:1, partial [Racocetra persica]
LTLPLITVLKKSVRIHWRFQLATTLQTRYAVIMPFLLPLVLIF